MAWRRVSCPAAGCGSWRSAATAVGTGLNAPPASVRRWRRRLKQRLGSPFGSAPNKFPGPRRPRTAGRHTTAPSRCLRRLAPEDSPTTSVGWGQRPRAAASANLVLPRRTKPGSQHHAGQGSIPAVRKASHGGHQVMGKTQAVQFARQPGKLRTHVFKPCWPQPAEELRPALRGLQRLSAASLH